MNDDFNKECMTINIKSYKVEFVNDRINEYLDE